MFDYQPILQTINVHGYHTDVLRLDLVDEEVSGNKWFKLRHNLERAQREGYDTLLTFGGPHSNHIVAAAAACKLVGLRSIGVIRGEQVNNDTLQRAVSNGMLLHFVSREPYGRKTDPEMLNGLTDRFGRFYLVPEGGNNAEGLLGCGDILHPQWDHDYIFCACGTGTTYAGLLTGVKKQQVLVGISVLKGTNRLPQDVREMLIGAGRPDELVEGNDVLDNPVITRHCIVNRYAFSGYAKYDVEVADFAQAFVQQYRMPLDHVYTSKLFYAVDDLARRKLLRGKLLVVHSGGLQGNAAFEKRYHLRPIL